MADKVSFDLVSPERLLITIEVDMVVVPGSEGYFGVLAGHQPTVASLRPGVVEIHNEGEPVERIYVGGGFAEVTHERLVVLAEEAVPVAELDRATLEQRIRDTEEDLADATSDDSRRQASAALANLRDLLQVAS